MAQIYKVINGQGTGSGSGTDPYVAVFNSGASWGSPSAGVFQISILAATHNKGTDPIVQVFETVSGDDILVDVSTVSVDGAGNIILEVTETIDTRFAGKAVIR